MLFENPYPLSVYQEVTPLCEKGHIVLVKNEADGQLYVKKTLKSYSLEVYQQLRAKPVENTPTICGLYVEKSTAGPEGQIFTGGKALGADPLVVIEEYLTGSTLEELLHENGIFSEKATIRICLQLCRILMELHGRRPAVIHRDIKPSNVLFSPEGCVKLLDFNAAKVENAARRQDTQLLGTAGFAAPEQYGFSASSPQTDIYAMGVLMNTMLTGNLPTDQLAGGRLRRIILQCLQMAPKDRYPEVRELYRALQRADRVRSEWLPPGFRTMRLPRMLLATGGYLLILAVALSMTQKTFSSAGEMHLFRAAVLSASFLTIGFLFDYQGIRRKFPLMRSTRRWVRGLGIVVDSFLIFWTALVFHVALTVLFL